MKAFLLDRYGKTGTTRIGDAPVPAVGDNDVLVQVHAASVNPVDFKIRDGELKQVLRFRLPIALGNDFAGVVTQVGARVTRFQVGDAVYGRPDKSRIGTFAEFIAVREQDLAPKPANTTMVEAASLPLVGLTAWQALVERTNVQPGQRVLIHAGSGGVGVFAIQLAKHLDAFVATTTSTPNVDWVQQLGADQVVDYKKEAFEDVLRDIDMVLDTLGPENVAKSFRVMRPGGKLISIAGPPDPAFAPRIRPAVATGAGDAAAELAHAQAGQATRRVVCVPVHASGWRTVAPDRRGGGSGHHQARDRQGVSVRPNSGRAGLCRNRARERESGGELGLTLID